MRQPVVPHKYSESLVDLPQDLIESELNRIAKDTSWDARVRATLIRCELNRRLKLRTTENVCNDGCLCC